MNYLIGIIKRFYRRVVRSISNPSSFLIEYNINPDFVGPILLLVLYFAFGFLVKLLSLGSANNESFLLSIVQGSLNLSDALISVGTILFTIQLIKVKLETKKDFGMFLYSFSVKVISYALSFLVFLMVYIPVSYKLILSEVLIGIATFWAILLQAYYMNRTKKISFITASFISLSAWLISVLINDLISFEIANVLKNFS